MSEDSSVKDFILMFMISLIIVLGVILVILCAMMVVDLVTLQTSIENATITSITTTNEHYTYDLNVSGSRVINVMSNDFYQLNQTLNVALTRGSFTHSPYGGVLIIGEV